MELLSPKKRFLNINLPIIIRGCQQNDILCQEQLYKLFYPEMIKVCSRYATDSDGAGTIYNNAMLRVFKSIGEYKEEGKLRAWVKTIVVHCCIDFCKKKMVLAEELSEDTNEEVSISSDVFNVVSAKEIQKIIADLPQATAVVFNMYVYEGYTHKQIGENLGISDGTSKWHFSEAKRILKSKIEGFSSTSTKSNAAG
ncbi:MAG: sigma-70 family RNA polymerase sigma factor [Ferruginibacter sp.]